MQYLHVHSCFFSRMLGDFSKKCFNLGRNAYERKKKFPKRYMLFTLKFQGEKTHIQENNALFNICFLGLSYT